VNINYLFCLFTTKNFGGDSPVVLFLVVYLDKGKRSTGEVVPLTVKFKRILRMGTVKGAIREDKSMFCQSDL
jgi:hypothetical protein